MKAAQRIQRTLRNLHQQARLPVHTTDIMVVEAIAQYLNEQEARIAYLEREVAILNAREGHRTLDQFPASH